MPLSNKFTIGSGQVYRHLHWGTYAFTTTSATQSVVVPLRHVEAVIILPIGAPASDEKFSVNNTIVGTPNTGNECRIAGNGNGTTTLTITRTGAAKTSALKYFLVALGG